MTPKTKKKAPPGKQIIHNPTTPDIGGNIKLDNIIQYSIRPELNHAYKTCCMILDKAELPAESSINIANLLNSAPVKKVVSQISKLIGQDVSQEIKVAIAGYITGIIENKLTEAVFTIEMHQPVKHLMNFIFLYYDSSIIKANSAYKFLESLRELGGHICHSLRKNELRNFNLYILAQDKQNLKYLLCILEGFLLAMYSFDKYKTQVGKQIPQFRDQVINSISNTKLKSELLDKITGIGSLKLQQTKKNKTARILSSNPNNYAVNIVHYGGNETTKQLMSEIGRLVIIMKSIYVCRDLINEPGNILTTNSLTNLLKSKWLAGLPITVESYSRDDCKKLGMGLLVAVGNGSDQDRQSGLIILKYNGAGAGAGAGASAGKNKSYCLIGKGITQDTGGYSLKDTADIIEMKSDKSGACIVLATIICCARLQLPINVIGMLPLAQNSIGPGAMVPGDIVSAYNGLTVEITDPDAEGRLILADCIAYAADKYPKHQIIDLATLTFEQEAVSCKKFSTLIEVNSSQVADKLIVAGELEGERIIKMPFIPDFDDTIASDVADLKNTATTCQGDIYPSAMFMSSFLKPDSSWIHIDLGGNTFKVDTPYLESGALASGVGVKLLINLLSS